MAIAKFYETVVGFPIAIEAGVVSVSPTLRFAQSATSPSLWSADARLELRVENLRATANRLHVKVIRDPAIGDHILVADPDGRSVRIEAAPS